MSFIFWLGIGLAIFVVALIACAAFVWSGYINEHMNDD